MKALRILSILLFAGAAMFTMPAEAKKKPKTPQQTLKDQLTPVMPNGEQNLYIFCEEEGLDKPGEYMAGFGIYEGAETRQEALLEANRIAVTELGTKFAGVINNAISDYNKSTKIPSAKKISESQREALTTSVAQEAVNKYGNAVCRKMSQAADGSYIGYVALHFMESEMDRAMTEQMQEMKVDFDRDQFMKSMQEQLDKFNEQKAKELSSYGE